MEGLNNLSKITVTMLGFSPRGLARELMFSLLLWSLIKS